jgi:hypothetical protein
MKAEKERSAKLKELGPKRVELTRQLEQIRKLCQKDGSQAKVYAAEAKTLGYQRVAIGIEIRQLLSIDSLKRSYVEYLSRIFEQREAK